MNTPIPHTTVATALDRYRVRTIWNGSSHTMVLSREGIANLLALSNVRLISVAPLEVTESV